MGGSFKPAFDVTSNKTKAKDEKKKAEGQMKHEEAAAKATKPPAPRQKQASAAPRLRFRGKRLLSRNGGAPFFLVKKVDG